jgi:hypothetical protein
MQDRNNRPPPSYRNSKAKKEDPRERERERESRAAKTTLRVQKRIPSYQSKTKRNNSANKQTNKQHGLHTYISLLWFVT